MNNLNELSKQIYEGNKLRGFDVSKENIGQTLMLVVSELAEALEADRKDKRKMLNAFEQDLGYAKLSISDFETENENCDWLKNRFETTMSRPQSTFAKRCIRRWQKLTTPCQHASSSNSKKPNCKKLWRNRKKSKPALKHATAQVLLHSKTGSTPRKATATHSAPCWMRSLAVLPIL